MPSEIDPPPTPRQSEARVFRFNPFLPEFHIDPYPIYRRLRTEVPLYQTQSFQGEEWLLTRYADVKAVLNDPRFHADDLPRRLEKKSLFLKQPDAFAALNQTISPWLFFLDPPDHTRLRSLVGRAFSVGELERLRPQIQCIVDELLKQRRDDQTLDIMAELAAPLPATVSALMLGVPNSDRPQLIHWSYQLFRVFDQPLSLEDYKSLDRTAVEFQAYLCTLLEERRRQPQDDLMSLLAAAVGESKLSFDEAIGFCAMLFSVGQETTENSIGNSVLALLRHPDQLDRLQQNPDLSSSAIEELLRYDSPVQIVARTVKEDVDFRGKTLKAGGRVHLCLGAANRDPDAFPNPDLLDLSRRGTSPIPFGAGIHYCLGSVLARMEGQIAINTLLQQYAQIHLADESLQWRKNLVLRGLVALRIATTPR
ncbi:cytochrome P450 [Altericista sp. CCNU0014]|uniref:cytochrome P450 n=1 Tax=Altericista sp. CCNU0014 TaxID=3082949 RepID=UPI00384D5292